MPRNMLSGGLRLLRQSVEVLKAVNTEPDTRIAWQELQNKLEAFLLFEQVDVELKISQLNSRSLEELVERVRWHDSYRSVWLMEGLGHYYSDLHLRCGEAPSAIRSSPLPRASLVPLHAGMGLSLAEWLLPHIEQSPAALRTFIELCGSNSQPGYFGAACEALGLATRNLFPHLLGPIDQALSLASKELVAYFWHGAGRAIYFSPTNFLPWRSAPWKGLWSCLQEPPHAEGRSNAAAGFCWALTLVNVQQPQIIETFLKHHAKEIDENEACANGIRSALAIWAEATSCMSSLEALRRHQPAPATATLWQKHVRRSCEEAMEHHQDRLSKSAPGELFRYQA